GERALPERQIAPPERPRVFPILEGGIGVPAMPAFARVAGHQAEIASSPGGMGRVRGSRPRRARSPIHPRLPTNTTSLTTSKETPAGRTFHRDHSTGCETDPAPT